MEGDVLGGVLADIWGSPKKRKSPDGTPVKYKSPKLGSPRTPLSPSKINIDNNRLLTEAQRKTVKRNLFDDVPVKKITALKIAAKNEKLKIVTPRKARKSHDEIFGKIKAALNLECPDKILGRETEFEAISGFISGCLKKEEGKSMYVSGQPGTGKSATINNVIKELNYEHTVFINCMAVEKAEQIYTSLLDKFNSKIAIPKTLRWQKKKFHDFASDPSKPMKLLVLDEMDQLSSKSETVLYDLFDLAGSKDSRLIVIGIANGLDLLDRVLPNLSRRNHPKQYNFIPYTATQIADLVKDRLTPEMLTKLEPSSILMCAKRISALAGDARKALDVLRGAVELAGRDRAPKVTIMHVNNVLNKTYTDRSTEDVPLQQQLVIITFILLAREEKAQNTMTVLLKKYKTVSEKAKLPKAEDSEIKDVMDLMIQSALVSKYQPTGRKLPKYSLSMDEETAARKIAKKSLIALLS